MSPDHASEHPRDILHSHGLRARRSAGQNFLLSPKVAARIVQEARVGPQDVVLEIGTGLGQLTVPLAQAAHAVVSVEIDRGFCEIARERLEALSNVVLLCADFLASKHCINPAVSEAVLPLTQGHPLKVVSNLPFQISSPALINLLEWEVAAEMDVMLQKEVVERLTAHPGAAAYGPLTVFTAYWAQVEEVFSLPPTAFWPQPAVSSAFVRLTPRAPCPRAENYQVFSEAVRKLFQSRRKTLRRALEQGWGRPSAQLVMSALPLDRTVRPDRLAVEDFVRIGDVLAAERERTDT